MRIKKKGKTRRTRAEEEQPGQWPPRLDRGEHHGPWWQLQPARGGCHRPWWPFPFLASSVLCITSVFHAMPFRLLLVFGFKMENVSGH